MRRLAGNICGRLFDGWKSGTEDGGRNGRVASSRATRRGGHRTGTGSGCLRGRLEQAAQFHLRASLRDTAETAHAAQGELVYGFVSAARGSWVPAGSDGPRV